MRINTIISKIINYFRLFGKRRHKYKISQSKKVQSKIIEISKLENGNARAIGYLKKIDPYVFEELLLSAIEEQNIYIIRNKSYSGDGGFDGAFKIKGKEYLIQAKRYKNEIKLEHVKQFSNQISSSNCAMGLFIHTGKTGTSSKQIFKENEKINFISGSKLVDLLTNKTNIRTYLESQL